jgi:hypothetical protein
MAKVKIAAKENSVAHAMSGKVKVDHVSLTITTLRETWQALCRLSRQAISLLVRHLF